MIFDFHTKMFGIRAHFTPYRVVGLDLGLREWISGGLTFSKLYFQKSYVPRARNCETKGRFMFSDVIRRYGRNVFYYNWAHSQDKLICVELIQNFLRSVQILIPMGFCGGCYLGMVFQSFTALGSLSILAGYGIEVVLLLSHFPFPLWVSYHPYFAFVTLDGSFCSSFFFFLSPALSMSRVLDVGCYDLSVTRAKGSVTFPLTIACSPSRWVKL